MSCSLLPTEENTPKQYPQPGLKKGYKRGTGRAGPGPEAGASKQWIGLSFKARAAASSRRRSKKGERASMERAPEVTRGPMACWVGAGHFLTSSWQTPGSIPVTPPHPRALLRRKRGQPLPPCVPYTDASCQLATFSPVLSLSSPVLSSISSSSLCPVARSRPWSFAQRGKITRKESSSPVQPPTPPQRRSTTHVSFPASSPASFSCS